MWSILARLMAVFVPWALLLAIAVVLGAPARIAELAACAGAGLTLIARAWLGRPRPLLDAPPHSEPERRRASG